MEEQVIDIAGRERTPLETVEELPGVAIKDKVIFNSTDRCFYIGKDDKEDN